MKKKKSRLGQYLAVLIVIVISFVAIAKVTSDIISANLRENTNEHYQLLANDTAEKINAWLSAKKEIIENQRAAIEKIGDFSPEYLSDFLAHAVLGRKDLNEICDLYFVNPDNVLSTGNGFFTDPDIDLRERDWYQSCLVTRDLFYSSPYLDLSTGSYVMTISVSVNDSSGKFMGVLALDLYIDAFLNAVSLADVPDNSYIFLLDSEFGIAAHRNPEYGYIGNLPQQMSLLPDNIYGELEKTIRRGKYEIKLIRDYDGVMRDMFMSNIDCCSWCIVAAISEDVMRSSETLMIIYIIAALFVSLVFGILWTLFGTRRIMRQLEEAMDEANAANETKSSFLANMSHEIRTPINAVIGMNEMIQREDISETVRDYTLDISAASRSLIGIINDILDFSKIESGKLELVETEFNIASMINDVVSLSVSRLGEKQLELLVSVDPDIPKSIIGDEIRIKQTIVNLMTNGIKYTNEGFVHLDVTFTKHDYGINLDISVKDSGIGIRKEDLEKLFTSFQQIDTKRNRSVEGTGLGLAITKRLIGRMGGFVSVDSEYGTGSEFRITIPLKTASDEPFISVSGAGDIHAVCLFGFSGQDVCTVDEYMRMLLEMRRKLEIDLHICTDASRMKELISGGEINMVFVDSFNYIEHEKYLLELPESVSVFLVQSRINVIRPPKRVRSIYKPFYEIPLAAVINNDSSGLNTDGVKESDSAFTAPEAKILIVDDNMINLKVAAGLMKPYKMKVFTADSGERAIEMLEETPDYTIVFMDHMMPKMDGVEAVGIIRSKGGEYFSRVPIVALTANTVNDARNMFLSSGFDDFLAKPIDTGLLDRTLRKFIPDSLRVSSLHSTVRETAVKQEPEQKAEAVFEPQDGLAYSGGDEELYAEILTEYVSSGRDMRETLIRACLDKDWQSYIINVHALKSTSLNIGAKPLSEYAKKLELAGKAGDYDTLIRGNDELFSRFDEVISKATEHLARLGIVISPDGEDSQSLPAAELTDISRGRLDDIIRAFLNACDNFNREAAIVISREASGMRCGDIVLSEYFSEAEKLVEDFEYGEAAELITSLKEGGRANE